MSVLSRLKRIYLEAGLLLLVTLMPAEAKQLYPSGDTPLPSHFQAVQLNEHGIFESSLGTVTILDFQQHGTRYVAQSGGGTVFWAFRKWDAAPNLYSFEMTVAPDEAAPPLDAAVRGLATIRDINFVLYTPSYPSKDVASIDELNEVLRSLNANLSGATKLQYVLATTPEEMTELKVAVEDMNKQVNSTPAQGLVHVPVPSSPPVGNQTPAPTGSVQQATDPGADTPNSCDQLAAHPKDPKRMARGVPIDQVIPGAALKACQEAVAAFPHTPRFWYQLGRAEEASDDLGGALAHYGRAAVDGYAAAFLNMGIIYADGSVFPRNVAQGVEYMRKAEAGGVDVRDVIAQYVFSRDGFSDPLLFQKVYDGSLPSSAIKDQSIYWLTFTDQFFNEPLCAERISGDVHAKLKVAASNATLGNFVTGLQEANQAGHSGLDGAFQDGMTAANHMNTRVLATADNAIQDALLFAKRYTCSGPVPEQFFQNLSEIVGQL